MGFIDILNGHYPMRFDKYEMLRDGGSASYAVFSGENKYFMRAVKPAFHSTALIGADIQVYLHKNGFFVPSIIPTNIGLPYLKTEDEFFIIYEFIEGKEIEPEQDAETVGEIIGSLHHVMKGYPGELEKKDKHFYIGRYVEILRNRDYPRADEFTAYGEQIWDKIKELPRGFCHGDMYCGNIHKTPYGKLYLLDFDTACDGFPMYDPALICDMTDYFHFDERNFDRSKKVLARFVPEYTKYSSLSQSEIDAFSYLIAMQHFSTQATIMEIFGYDCLNDAELDYQLEWLCKWLEQCERDVG